jgi:hypothetical protein
VDGAMLEQQRVEGEVRDFPAMMISMRVCVFEKTQGIARPGVGGGARGQLVHLRRVWTCETDTRRRGRGIGLDEEYR